MASGRAWRRVTTVAVGRWVRVVDVVVTVALAGSSIVAIGLGDPSWGTVLPVALVLALCSTVPVAWRSRFPVGAATVVVLADAGCAFAAAPYQSAFQPFVALALVAYSLGSRAEGRPATWAPPALLALLSCLSFEIWASTGQSPGNLVPSVLWLAAAWVVGRIVRSSRLKNDELARAYDELSRQRELQAEAAVAIERGRIARELHDIVAHNVSMMVVQAGAADRVLGDGPSDVRAALEAIASTGRQTVDEMRTLLGVLRQEETPVALRPQPSLADLDSLLDGVRAAGLPVELRLEGERCTLPPAIDMSVYRIVQEGLTNALKHAGPAEARVTIRFSSQAVDVEIRDSGSTVPDGAPRATRNPGHGLVGMHERAAMFGGHLVAAAEPTGFAVRASLPLTPPVAST
jgi:signal transduction histidine kinase